MMATGTVYEHHVQPYHIAETYHVDTMQPAVLLMFLLQVSLKRFRFATKVWSLVPGTFATSLQCMHIQWHISWPTTNLMSLLQIYIIIHNKWYIIIYIYIIFMWGSQHFAVHIIRHICAVHQFLCPQCSISGKAWIQTRSLVKLTSVRCTIDVP
jgi:hypothetical protein